MHIATVIAALLAVPLAAAGMYDKPVVNLDAKQFKKVMANEHAAVSPSSLVLPSLSPMSTGPLITDV